MDCRLVSAKLVQYLDEDLPLSTYRQISDHLDECYLCAEEFHELVRVTDLSRQALRCPVHRDGFDLLRSQLHWAGSAVSRSDILLYPRRLRRLKSVATGAAVAAAVALFAVTVGLPAVEAVQAFDAVMNAQFTGQAPVAAPAEVRGHSLVAWSSQIRWAEKLALDTQQAPAPPAKEPAAPEPVSRVLRNIHKGRVLYCDARHTLPFTA